MYLNFKYLYSFFRQSVKYMDKWGSADEYSNFIENIGS
jgi:hypothetical protein